MDSGNGEHKQTSYHWGDLEVFLIASAKGSLSKASMVLAVSQSTVTRRLRALEGALEVTLLERSADGVALTDAGRQLVPLAEKMRALAGELEESIRGQPPTVRGRVRVAMPEGIANFLVVPKLAELHALHPEVELDILAGVELVDISRGEVDLALRFSRPEEGPLTLRRLRTIEYRVFVPTRFFKRRRRTLSTAELGKLGWVGWAPVYDSAPDAMWLRRVLPNANYVARLRSLGSIACAVDAGVGAALLPVSIGQRLKNVMQVEVEAATPKVPLWLVGREDNRDVFRIRAVSEFLVRVCKSST